MRAPLMRHYFLLIIMLVSAYLAYFLTPKKNMTDQHNQIVLTDAIPKKFKDWVMLEDSVTQSSPEVQEALNKLYSQMLVRSYTNTKGQSVMLLIAYGSKQTRELQAHRQELCYAGQGFTIRGVEYSTLALFNRPVNITRVEAEKENRYEPLTYWFTLGGGVVRSMGFERIVTQLKYGLMGIVPDGYLIRVSTLNLDKKAAYALQAEFATDLINSVDASVRDRLIGVAHQNK